MAPSRTEPISRTAFSRTGETPAAQTDYRVTVLNGPDAGKSLSLDGTVTIGSSPDAVLCLSDSTVSRFHAELQPRADGVLLRDLQSRNGTFVAGARIEEVLLQRETSIEIGQTHVRVFVQERLPPVDECPTTFGDAIGKSPVMRRLFASLTRAAATRATVLLMGETGTGKEVLARAIHGASERAGGPFQVFDCGAVSPNLIEAELFGHAKGAFTGATAPRAGAFVAAHGGTLFLDEIGELPLDLQPKLLRALESGTVKRLGDDEPRQVDVRVVAATHRDLDAAVREGRFRADLYFRLAVVTARVPALRERPEDVIPLAERFVTSLGKPEVKLSPELVAQMIAHPWPGNVRELRNVVTRALAGDDSLGPAVPAGPGGSASDGLTDLPFREAKDRILTSFTRAYLAELLQRCEGNVSEAARTAGMARSHLHELLLRHGIKTSGGKGEEGEG
jgi:DNA-binding NtrC family response regulator